MIADMTSAGLAPSTKAVYIQGVRGLAAHYRRSPDQLNEGEVRSYLLYLRDQRGVALGTYAPHHGGILYLFVPAYSFEGVLCLCRRAWRQVRQDGPCT
jgi:hypothetical protein